jgi:hypothetical protein
MPTSTDDVEMNVVLSMLAGESSNSARTESTTVAIGQDLGEDEEIQKSEGARHKRSRRVNHPAAPGEEKKRRRLQRLSCLEQDAGPSILFLGDGPMSTILEDNVRGCDDAWVAGGVLDEDEEEEEEEVSLIRKNSYHNRGSDIPMQALSALVSLKGLSISDFDQALEEIIPENLLSEPPEVDNPVICSEVSDDVLLPCNPVGQEATWTVSRASTTLEGGLAREGAPALNAADSSDPTPMGMAEGSSALEVAATEGPTLEGWCWEQPSPRGCWGRLPFCCFHGRPRWITTGPIRGGSGDTLICYSHWSGHFRGQRPRR